MSQIAKKGNGIAARCNKIRDTLLQNKEHIFAALPRHLTAERMARVTVTCIRRNPKLLDCTEASLYGAIVEAATLGLEPDGVLGHAYLIPYGREATLVPGYKGLLSLARRSGEISTITCEAVHEGDSFAYQLGDDPWIKHAPDDANPARDLAPITHVYLVVQLRDGGVQRKVWSAAKIDAHKMRYSPSSGKKDSPWSTNWEAMAKKTLIRDCINRGEIPVSVEVQRLAAREERAEVDAWKARDVVESSTVANLDELAEKITATPEDAAAKDAADAVLEQSLPAGTGVDLDGAEADLSAMTTPKQCKDYWRKLSDKCVDAGQAETLKALVDRAISSLSEAKAKAK